MKLFVYGSLLSNFAASSLLPEGADRKPARMTGRLYHCRHCGFPAVVIPEAAVHAAGSDKYQEDESLENTIPVPEKQQFDGDWGQVQGELVTFDDPETVMPIIDRYEGYSRSDPLYRRSLIPVETAQGSVWAWIYHFNSEEDIAKVGISYQRIRHGSWAKFALNT